VFNRLTATTLAAAAGYLAVYNADRSALRCGALMYEQALAVVARSANGVTVSSTSA